MVVGSSHRSGGRKRRIGVLALQGDFARHAVALQEAGAQVLEVRTPRDLEGLDGLVMPGGESTAMLKLMERTGLESSLRTFYTSGGALFGTCAGLILIAAGVTEPTQRSLGLLDVDVERNSYGRQVDSFEIDLPWSGNGGPLRGVFIRAPRITRVGPAVQVLARQGGDAVLVREGSILASTFHPELTGDLRVHRYFVEEVSAPREPAPA